jgi:hypothetical protein
MNELTNMDKLIADIIPPDDYQHRNGFSNTHIIDKLNSQERVLVEDALLNKLLNKTDMLIVETLAYMKSLKSLPILINLLNQCSDAMCRIIIATSVFEINHNNEMIVIGVDAFKSLDNTYQKISAFYYLRKFKNEATDTIIREYTLHSDFLLSYNAKQALNK